MTKIFSASVLIASVTLLQFGCGDVSTEGAELAIAGLSQNETPRLGDSASTVEPDLARASNLTVPNNAVRYNVELVPTTTSMYVPGQFNQDSNQIPWRAEVARIESPAIRHSKRAMAHPLNQDERFYDLAGEHGVVDEATRTDQVARDGASYFASTYQAWFPDGKALVYVYRSLLSESLTYHPNVESFGAYLCAPVFQNGHLQSLHCGLDPADSGDDEN